VVYSTRGSFYSDQAIAGAELFKKLYSEDWLVEGVTYLFEYVGPSNRIVVNYSEDNLILHGAIYTDSGLDFEVKEPFEKVKSYEMQGAIFGDSLYNHLLNLNISNEEGFVIKVKEHGLPTWMCKIKFEDYCLLHKIVTGVSNKTVWEMLKDGKPFDEILEVCPDEFNEWLKNTKAYFELGYLGIESRAKYAYDCVRELPNRKEQAMALMSNHKELSAIVFKMLDSQDYSGSIWNMIKPDRFVQPFANKSEKLIGQISPD
jgi:RNA ligase